MDRIETGTKSRPLTLSDTYWSIGDLVETTRQYRDLLHSLNTRKAGSWEDVDGYISDGWQDGLTDALPIINSAVATVQAQRPVTIYEPEWDKTGSEVDISRYLAGRPECMIEYQPLNVSRVGRVITVCTSVGAIASVTNERIIRKGAAVVALALSLERLQHPCEIWLDSTVMSTSGRNRLDPSRYGRTRLLIKGAHDAIDPAKLAYWLSHPTVLRRLMFASRHHYPQHWVKFLNIGDTYGSSVDPKQDLPDGTIYLPALGIGRDKTADPERFVTQSLREIGLLA